MAVNTRILFTDLDGTLLNDNKEISEGNRAAVEDLQERDVMSSRLMADRFMILTTKRRFTE